MKALTVIVAMLSGFFAQAKMMQQPASTPLALAEKKAEKAALNAKPVRKENITRGPYHLFGESHSQVSLKSTQLQGKVFYIVSGHGGNDTGAIGKKGHNTLCEDEYTYDIALRLARQLVAHGATPYVIVRDPDDGIRDENFIGSTQDKHEVYWKNTPIPTNHRDRLHTRIKIIDTLYQEHGEATDQRIIFLHIDSRPDASEQIDVYFLNKRNDGTGRQLSSSIRNVFATKYSTRNRPYHGKVKSNNWLFVHRYTNHIPSTFIELGNIHNPLDQLRFTLSSNREALANWITEGVLSSFE